jgi:hypothetical protein
MKLLQLRTQGYRALPEQDFGFTEPSGAARPLSVITGPPGVGLTSVLEAIVLVAARLGNTGGLPDPLEHLRAEAAVSVLTSTWELDELERDRGGTRSALQEAEIVVRRAGLGGLQADPALLAAHQTYDHRGSTPKVVYFPAQRVSNAAYAPLRDFENEQKHARLLTHADKFAGLPRALMGLVLAGKADVLEKVKLLFRELAPSCRLVGLTQAGLPEFCSDAGGTVGLRRLSATERNAFVFASSAILMGLDRSVILVDTPEVGLAPGEAARWISVLSGSLPESQWIVATRDPALVGSRALTVGVRR